MANSFGTEGTLSVGNTKYKLHRLQALKGGERLPFSLKVLLENLLRHEDDRTVRRDDVEALVKWNPQAEPDREIAFRPARVLLQDFTGVPCIVDLAAMRDAITRLGGDRAAHQSAGADGPRHRSLGAGRLVRVGEELRPQRHARVRAQQGALCAPALGAAGVPPLPRRAAGHGHLPPGEPRVSGAGGVPRRRRARVSRHARRHRLAHDDDQLRSACSAGASAASRPRRRCSGSRCRC